MNFGANARGMGAIAAEMIYQFEDFKLDTDRHELTKAGAVLAVEPQVFALLELLVTNPDRMIPKDEIIEKVWNGRIVSDGSLNTRIRSLRKTLDDDGKQQRLIKTHHGQGFRFVGNPKTEYPSTQAGASEEQTVLALPDRPSIAVLPFDNMSPDPEQEFLADGMCEDILTALSKDPQLFVIARNSTFQYKGRAVDVREVGRELGVAYVLEGSVRSSGERLRITAQLIDARTGEHVWAERYDRQKEDIFELQDQMTRQIVSELLGELVTTNDQAKIWVGGTENFGAWQAVVRATALVATMERASLIEAVRLLETAIEFDPLYASAHVVLANAHFHFAINGWSDDPSKSLAAIAKHAKMALDIDPTEPLATALLSFIALASGDLDEADRLATRAAQLGPDIIANIIMVAMVFVYVDRCDAAAKLTEHALRLSPIARTTISTTAAFVFTSSEDFEAALQHCEILLDDDPHNLNGLVASIISHQKLGRIDVAAQYADRLLRAFPEFAIERYLASRFLATHPIGERSRSALLAAGLQA